MLFQLTANTPRFESFRLLNSELIYFLERSIPPGKFRRELFSNDLVGQSCWNNAKTPNGKNDLTFDKFKKLFLALQNESEDVRRRLFEVAHNNQDLCAFFEAPNPGLLEFLPEECVDALTMVATHLYCATKDLQEIIAAAGGADIRTHFELFRAQDANGNICKACGLEKLAVFRAGVPDGKQWRADYDHQLCKSKYPIFAVHPDNLIPLCDVCNQDAKKAKDLFKSDSGRDRLAFYPYTEEAKDLINVELESVRDPEPVIRVVWATNDNKLREKLETWDEIYEIRNRVKGHFLSLGVIFEDEIYANNFEDFQNQIIARGRPVPDATLKRKAGAFWYQKLFEILAHDDLAPFWEKSRFAHRQAISGGIYIMSGDEQRRI